MDSEAIRDLLTSEVLHLTDQVSVQDHQLSEQVGPRMTWGIKMLLGDAQAWVELSVRWLLGDVDPKLQSLLPPSCPVPSASPCRCCWPPPLP